MRGEVFSDRAEAGRLLASALVAYRSSDAIVLAIPRGGVPVGHALAKALHLPLDVLLCKKIGHPRNPEFAVGAVSMEGVHVDDRFQLPADWVTGEVERLRQQMRDRIRRYRGQRPVPALEGRTVILVDDGVATGHTLLASIALLRAARPGRLVVAMPVVPAAFVPTGRAAADEFVFLLAPEEFEAVGQFYADFSPVEDDEVVRLLNDAWSTTRA